MVRFDSISAWRERSRFFRARMESRFHARRAWTLSASGCAACSASRKRTSVGVVAMTLTSSGTLGSSAYTSAKMSPGRSPERMVRRPQKSSFSTCAAPERSSPTERTRSPAFRINSFFSKAA